MAEKLFTSLLIAWVLLCPVICGNCPMGHHHGAEAPVHGEADIAFAEGAVAHRDAGGTLPGPTPAHDPQDSCSIEQCFCSGTSVSPESRTPAVFLAIPAFFESPSGANLALRPVFGPAQVAQLPLHAAHPTAFISLLI
jgi:hypothetical protein